MAHTNACIERTVKGTVKDLASKIQDFKKRFESLQQDCMQGTTLHGAIVTFRLLDKVDKICE